MKKFKILYSVSALMLACGITTPILLTTTSCNEPSPTPAPEPTSYTFTSSDDVNKYLIDHAQNNDDQVNITSLNQFKVYYAQKMNFQTWLNSMIYQFCNAFIYYQHVGSMQIYDIEQNFVHWWEVVEYYSDYYETNVHVGMHGTFEWIPNEYVFRGSYIYDSDSSINPGGEYIANWYLYEPTSYPSNDTDGGYLNGVYYAEDYYFNQPSIRLWFSKWAGLAAQPPLSPYDWTGININISNL